MAKKYKLLYGSIKNEDGSKSRPGDTVEVPANIASRMLSMPQPKIAEIKAKAKPKKKEDKDAKTTKEDKETVTTKSE